MPRKKVVDAEATPTVIEDTGTSAGDTLDLMDEAEAKNENLPPTVIIGEPEMSDSPNEVPTGEYIHKDLPEGYDVRTAPILTIDARGTAQTEEDNAERAWEDIKTAYLTHRILTGTFGGIEQLESGKTITIVEYRGYRVVIPLKEMVISFPNQLTGEAYRQMVLQYHKRLSNMLGAEIDFMVLGIDNKSKSIVASRSRAMLKKRQTFYMELDKNGRFRINEGQIVQARVLAVAEKLVRVEAFGVECVIPARDLSWDWIGDATERYAVGDEILIRILSLKRDNVEDISIRADVKSVSGQTQHDNLSKCRVQGKYAGKVTDVHKGTVYVRLTNGVNAIAHTCYDRRMPGQKDDVSFAVTQIDPERGVALGIITRIIRQNL